jgi:two-component system, sensor histidine kinase
MHDISLENRVLALLPNAADAGRTVAFLGEVGIPCTACSDMAGLTRALSDGAGALLVTEELLLHDTVGLLRDALGAQPPWSAVPLIVLARETSDARVDSALVDVLADVTLVERPVRQRALISVVRSALRARRHQYDIRDALVERKRAAEELARQAAQLREADRRKDEFLATLAHELRNPLAPIRTGLDVLKRMPHSEAANRAREMMDRQVGQMVRLIDDLMDVSRITLGKVTLKKERLTLRTVVDVAIETSRPLIDASHHTLVVDLPQEAIWVDADRTRLAQVLGNLLNNAAKYTPTGGQIAIVAGRDGDAAFVRIQDNGIGIARENISEAFELFSQLNRPLDRLHGGLGIGLALVKRLMDMHDGSVAAESEGVGRGTAVTIRLPATPAASEAASALPAAGGPNAEARRILVVDDNVDAAESLSMLLESLGHDIRMAHTGPAALKTALDFGPDLVLLDIGLPGLSGYEVARRFRADEKLAPAMLVAVTGWGSDEDRKKASDAGFDVHLTKPIEMTAIERVLAEAAARHLT